jgi:squalene synthase HpnC
MSAVAAEPRLPRTDAVLAQAPKENFPVASRLLGAAVRRHVIAIYGFARLVDDTGDEAEGDRLALLDELDREVSRLYAGEAPAHPLMRRLAPTVTATGIPPEPLRALIEAGRQDQRVSSYRTFDDLLGYCELSANPVGRMVLYVLGCATQERFGLSDAVCSGLQVVEHLQDVGEDLARGRVYLPEQDMRRFGCEPADLERRPTSGAVRALVQFEAGRARRLLDHGAPLVRALPARPALAVAAFVGGGRAALGAIERAGYDVLGAPPRASPPARAAAWLAVLREQLGRGRR